MVSIYSQQHRLKQEQLTNFNRTTNQNNAVCLALFYLSYPGPGCVYFEQSAASMWARIIISKMQDCIFLNFICNTATNEIEF